jgi:hypothetical protein
MKRAAKNIFPGNVGAGGGGVKEGKINAIINQSQRPLRPKI